MPEVRIRPEQFPLSERLRTPQKPPPTSSCSRVQVRKIERIVRSWSSLVEGGEGWYLPICQTNLDIVLKELSLWAVVVVKCSACSPCSNDPSSNPAEVYSFYSVKLFEKDENKQEEAENGPFFKNCLCFDSSLTRQLTTWAETSLNFLPLKSSKVGWTISGPSKIRFCFLNNRSIQ